jgi:hypothetical protein
MPPTGWTWKAEPTLVNLLPYLVDSRYFVIGWLFTAGLAFTIWQALRPLSGDDHPAHAARFLLVFYLPFFVIWWTLFSYDGRFLLVLTPFIAVMGAHLVRLSRRSGCRTPALSVEPRSSRRPGSLACRQRRRRLQDRTAAPPVHVRSRQTPPAPGRGSV